MGQAEFRGLGFRACLLACLLDFGPSLSQTPGTMSKAETNKEVYKSPATLGIQPKTASW